MLSNSYEGMYRCQAQEDSAGALETYYAANGTPVHMRANVLVTVAFEVVAGVSGKKKTQAFKLACCVGDVSHNGQEGLEYCSVTGGDIPLPRGHWDAH